MRKYSSLILAVQLSTSFAFFCAIGAHLVATSLNENWTFSVYFLLSLSAIFMLIPHLLSYREYRGEIICGKEHDPFEQVIIDEHGWVHDRAEYERWMEVHKDDPW